MPLRKPLSTLVEARASDLPLIDRWLIQRDICRWWGSPVYTQSEMRLGLFCHGDIGRVFIIHDMKKRPLGLVSVINVAAIAGSPIAWPSFLPKRAWEISILIARKGDRRRGIGTSSLHQAHKITCKDSVDPVFAWIEKDNKASLATFGKLGYLRAYEEETKTCSFALLQFDEHRSREN